MREMGGEQNGQVMLPSICSSRPGVEGGMGAGSVSAGMGGCLGDCIAECVRCKRCLQHCLWAHGDCVGECVRLHIRRAMVASLLKSQGYDVERMELRCGDGMALEGEPHRGAQREECEGRDRGPVHVGERERTFARAARHGANVPHVMRVCVKVHVQALVDACW